MIAIKNIYYHHDNNDNISLQIIGWVEVAVREHHSMQVSIVKIKKINNKTMIVIKNIYNHDDNNDSISLQVIGWVEVAVHQHHPV